MGKSYRINSIDINYNVEVILFSDKKEVERWKAPLHDAEKKLLQLDSEYSYKDKITTIRREFIHDLAQGNNLAQRMKQDALNLARLNSAPQAAEITAEEQANIDEAYAFLKRCKDIDRTAEPLKFAYEVFRNSENKQFFDLLVYKVYQVDEDYLLVPDETTQYERNKNIGITLAEKNKKVWTLKQLGNYVPIAALKPGYIEPPPRKHNYPLPPRFFDGNADEPDYN